MSDLNAIRRRKQQLLQDRVAIEDEMKQLEQAEQVLLRLASSHVESDDNSGIGPATVSMHLSNDLTGKSAAEAAEFVLSLSDKERQGMYYETIAGLAVRFGYRAGEPTIPSADSMRRAMAKHPEIFEPRGDGIYRLRRNSR